MSTWYTKFDGCLGTSETSAVAVTIEECRGFRTFLRGNERELSWKECDILAEDGRFTRRCECGSVEAMAFTLCGQIISGQECNNEMRIKGLTKEHEKQISFQSFFDFPAIQLKFAIEEAFSTINFLADCFKLTIVILWKAKILLEVEFVEDYFQYSLF